MPYEKQWNGNRQYGGGTYQKKPYTPRPQDNTTRAGINIGVAMNNVFGGLTFEDKVAIGKDDKKFAVLVDLVEKLVALQGGLMTASKAALED